MKKKTARETWWRAPVAHGLVHPQVNDSASSVDRVNNAIFGFSVIEIGEARGHGEEIDRTTLESVVDLANEKEIGLKMRFGHPEMSNDAIGSFAGRARRFRMVGDRVIADAFFDLSALQDPNKMAQRLLTRAETDPESFGTSLVLTRDLKFRLNKDGTNKTDDDGNDLPPLVRPIKVLASDFVDSPAATSSLFSNTNVILSSEATEVLENILSRPDARDRILGFLDRFTENREREISHNSAKGDKEMKPSTTVEPSTDLDKKDLWEFFKAFTKGKSAQDQQRGDVEVGEFMQKAAKLQVDAFVKSKISGLKLTPGVLSVNGLHETMCWLVSLEIFGDKERADLEKLRECDTLYKVADWCKWEDSRLFSISCEMFPAAEPFSTTLAVLGAFPGFTANRSGFRNFARKGDVDPPKGGGLHSEVDEGSLGGRYNSMGPNAKSLLSTLTNGKITDAESYDSFVPDDLPI